VKLVLEFPCPLRGAWGIQLPNPPLQLAAGIVWGSLIGSEVRG